VQLLTTHSFYDALARAATAYDSNSLYHFSLLSVLKMRVVAGDSQI
jgi:hypothetical protein